MTRIKVIRHEKRNTRLIAYPEMFDIKEYQLCDLVSKIKVTNSANKKTTKRLFEWCRRAKIEQI